MAGLPLIATRSQVTHCDKLPSRSRCPGDRRVLGLFAWIHSQNAVRRTMRRRDLIAFIGGVAAAWPLVARAQQTGKVPRVGILSPAGSEAASDLTAFRERLHDLGYIEGQTIVLDFRSVERDHGRTTGARRGVGAHPSRCDRNRFHKRHAGSIWRYAHHPHRDGSNGG